MRDNENNLLVRKLSGIVRDEKGWRKKLEIELLKMRERKIKAKSQVSTLKQ
jgi:hypothetical protein